MRQDYKLFVLRLQQNQYKKVLHDLQQQIKIQNNQIPITKNKQGLDIKSWKRKLS